MMRRDSTLQVLFTIVMLSIVTIVGGSCATKKEFVDLRDEFHAQNDKAESRFTSLEYSVSVLDSLMREQYRLSQSIRALMGTQSQEQRDNIEVIAARQDEINYQLRQLLERLQSIQLYGGVETKPSVTTPVSPQPQTPPSSPDQKTPAVAPSETVKVDPNELYNSALEDVRNGRFQLSESRFLSFLMQFPKHELAGNAQYWLGEAVYGQGKYDLAISEFEKVLEKYKESPKVPAALLKIGFAQLEQGKKKAATTTLNRLIKSFPQSEEADLARERLNTP